MENWGPSGFRASLCQRRCWVFTLWVRDVEGNWGAVLSVIPMQMTVPALCAFTSAPSSTPGRLMASWTALDRGPSNGSAMLTWPTMPFSKNVHGRT